MIQSNLFSIFQLCLNFRIDEINSKFNKTALFLAVERENIEIIKLFIANDKLDVNILNVFVILYLIKLKNDFYLMKFSNKII